MLNNNNGLTNIEDVRNTLKTSYECCHIMTKIMLKAWSFHSESRHKNGNQPFTFDNYTHHMRDKDYLEQVELNIIDCEDIGGKEETIKYLRSRMGA